jgi:hypothetical protein
MNKTKGRDFPHKVKVVYLSPPGTEDGWLTALEILMEATQKRSGSRNRKEGRSANAAPIAQTNHERTGHSP